MANIANLAHFVTLTLFASNYYSSFYCVFYLSLPRVPHGLGGGDQERRNYIILSWWKRMAFQTTVTKTA